MPQPEWDWRGHGAPDTNLLRLLVLYINCKALENKRKEQSDSQWCQRLTTSLTVPSRTKFLTVRYCQGVQQCVVKRVAWRWYGMRRQYYSVWWRASGINIFALNRPANGRGITALWVRAIVAPRTPRHPADIPSSPWTTPQAWPHPSCHTHSLSTHTHHPTILVSWSDRISISSLLRFIISRLLTASSGWKLCNWSKKTPGGDLKVFSYSVIGWRKNQPGS